MFSWRFVYLRDNLIMLLIFAFLSFAFQYLVQIFEGVCLRRKLSEIVGTIIKTLPPGRSKEASSYRSCVQQLVESVRALIVLLVSFYTISLQMVRSEIDLTNFTYSLNPSKRAGTHHVSIRENDLDHENMTLATGIALFNPDILKLYF